MKNITTSPVVNESKEVVVLKKQSSPLVEEATEIIITKETIERATEVLSKLNQFADRITEEKERITKPLNEALKVERGRWKPLEAMLDEGVSAIRSKLSAYQTAEMKRLREEEDAIAARVGEGKGKLKVETAVRKMNELDAPEKTVGSTSGLLKFRPDQRLKIVDRAKVSQEYLIVDEKKALEALKAGKVVPGCEIEVIQVPVNFR